MKKFVKSFSEGCLQTKRAKRVRLKKWDVIEYYDYGYQILRLGSDLTYLL